MTDKLVESVARAIDNVPSNIDSIEEQRRDEARAATLAVLEGISHPAMHKKIIDEHGAAPVVDFQKMIDHIKADLE